VPVYRIVRVIFEKAAILLFTSMRISDITIYVYSVIIISSSGSSTQYCAGGQIDKNEMGGTCSAYGGGERCVQGSGWET
jgi:hypothetical protein